MSLTQGWKDLVEDGATNLEWDAYDSLIRNEILDYNARLSMTPGYRTVDWKLIKAMVWVESGGPGMRAWTGRAMQIGNPGDRGWAALQAQDLAYSLVVPRDLKTSVRVLHIERPEDNIRAGIAYLFLRMCLSEIRPVPTDTNILSYTVAKGDNATSIATKLGTVVEFMAIVKKVGPNGFACPRAQDLSQLNPGDIIQYTKGERTRVITGWRQFTTTNIAAAYNGGGDAEYAAKLDYVVQLFQRVTRPESCAAPPLVPR